MIQQYTEEQFEKDREEIITWIWQNWKYGDSYLGNLLRAIKNLVENK